MWFYHRNLYVCINMPLSLSLWELNTKIQIKLVHMCFAFLLPFFPWPSSPVFSWKNPIHIKKYTFNITCHYHKFSMSKANQEKTFIANANFSFFVWKDRIINQLIHWFNRLNIATSDCFSSFFNFVCRDYLTTRRKWNKSIKNQK